MVVRNIRKRLRQIFKRRLNYEIELDEIFLDSTNLPSFDESQFEGRLEKPVGKPALSLLAGFFVLAALIGLGKVSELQLVAGAELAAQGEENRLRHSVIFPKRGVIYDRRGVELAWNEQGQDDSFPRRRYAPIQGIAHTVGYLSYPKKDRAGVYFEDAFVGKDGVEKMFNDRLGGRNGLKIIEENASGKVQSESTIEPPKDGEELTLSIDAKLTGEFHNVIAETVRQRGFQGGAGVLMDIATGELIALTSVPEYQSSTLTEGQDAAAIKGFVEDSSKPFLNRAVAGVYAPGSTVKPFVAIGVLDQHLIDPKTIIVSTGSLKVPNPYAPGQFSVFKDWKALGPVDMRRAIAMSSDVYFYQVGGGFEGQRGLGIENIAKYARLFGLARLTGVDLPGEAEGTIPTPAWKAENFEDGVWRVGDTYNTAIGQYGFQVTPLQLARGAAAIATDGDLVTPTILKTATTTPEHIPIAPEYFQIAREGMRLGVTEGVVTGLATPAVKVAAKTGTAQLGVLKQFVNSWVIGYFPYEHPRYAFAVVMERGPGDNQIGSVYVMRHLLDFMAREMPEYLIGEERTADNE